jgi:hypothetical protein
MRAAGLCVLALGGCAQVFGLDSPKTEQLFDGHAPDDTRGADVPLGCRGDNFDDNMLDGSRWMSFVEAGNTVTETNQRLELGIDGSPGAAYCGVDGTAPLAASDTGIQLEVPVPSADDASEVALVLFVNVNNQLVLGKDGTRLQAIVKTGGSTTSSKATVFDPNAHRWFRIERSGVDVTFSTSGDGAAWTPMWTATATFATQSLRPEIYAGHYMPVTPATVAVDNFEILPGDCPP